MARKPGKTDFALFLHFLHEIELALGLKPHLWNCGHATPEHRCNPSEASEDFVPQRPAFFFIMGMDLRLEIDLVPLSLKGLSDHLLIPASHVTVRGIVEIDSEIEGPKDDGWVTAVHHAHAHRGHLEPCLSESPVFEGGRFLSSPAAKEEFALHKRLVMQADTHRREVLDEFSPSHGIKRHRTLLVQS